MLGALLLLAWYPHGLLPTLAGLSVPLIDATFVIVCRLRKHQAPWFLAEPITQDMHCSERVSIPGGSPLCTAFRQRRSLSLRKLFRDAPTPNRSDC